MQILCGIDTVTDKRCNYLSNNPSALQKLCHASEIIRDDSTAIASVLAIKEAVIKALELEKPEWKGIEVYHTSAGKPAVRLANELIPKNLLSIDVSVTHENGLTTAMVVILLDCSMKKPKIVVNS